MRVISNIEVNEETNEATYVTVDTSDSQKVNIDKLRERIESRTLIRQKNYDSFTEQINADQELLDSILTAIQ